MKTVSVGITAYHAQDFLREAVDSVLEQSLPRGWDLELLIGVDGCERTWETVKRGKYGSRVRLVKMTENYGPYVTFNTLMTYARGDVIARFDADDVMLDRYLEHQLMILQYSPDISLTRTWCLFTDLHFNPVPPDMLDGISSAMPDGRRVSGSDGQCMFRKSVWNMLGGFRPWRCFADADFMVRVRALRFDLFEIPDYLYVRRIHPASLTYSPETGYGSRMREGYAELSRKEKTAYATPHRCYVSPVRGKVERIVDA